MPPFEEMRNIEIQQFLTGLKNEKYKQQLF